MGVSSSFLLAFHLFLDAPTLYYLESVSSHGARFFPHLIHPLAPLLDKIILTLMEIEVYGRAYYWILHPD